MNDTLRFEKTIAGLASAFGLSEAGAKIFDGGRYPRETTVSAPIEPKPASVSEAPKRPARRSARPAGGSRLVELREVIPFSPLPIKGAPKGGR